MNRNSLPGQGSAGIGSGTGSDRGHPEQEESRDTYLDLYEFAPVGYLTLNDKALITSVNLTGAMLLGVKRSNLLNTPFSKFIAETESDPWHRNFVNVLTKGEHLTCNPTLLRGDGSTFPARLEGVRFASSHDGAMAVHVAISDITGIRNASEAERHQSANLSILNDIITTANKADDLPRLLDSILAVSLRLLDFDAGGIYLVDRSTRTADVVHSRNLPPEFLVEIQTVPIDKKPYDTLFIKNEPIITENYAQIAPGRSAKFGFLSMASIPLLSKGVAIGALNIASLKRQAISEDERLVLTSIGWELGSTIERMAAEEEVKRVRENLETLFDSIEEMVFVLDMEGNILAVNNGVYKRLSYTPGSLIGTNVLHLHVPERRDEALRNVQGMIAGTIDSCPVPILTKNGTRIEVETTVTHGRWNNQEVLIGVSRDITERKVAEKALVESEVRFDQLAEQSNTVTWEVDLQGLYTYVSHVSMAVWSYRPDELVGQMHFYDLHPESGREIFRAACFEVFERKKQFKNLENAIQSRDGHVVWVSTNGIPLLDADGTLRGYRGSDTDITERRQVEEARIQFSDRLSLATLAGGVGIWDYDVIDNILSWDDRMYALYGITNEQFGGAYEAWQAGVHPGDQTRGDTEIQMALRGEKEFDTEFRVLWPDSSIRNIRALALVQRDAEGKPLRMIGTNWDITDQKKAEEEIRRQSGLIESLLDSIPDIIFFKDREGVYLGCNPPFAEFVGKSREEIAGRTDYDLFDKEIADFFREHDRRMLELDEPCHNEEWITYPDGRKILIDTLKTPYWGPDGTLIGVLGISRDITGRKRAEDAVLEANKKLNILNSITRHDVLNQISVLVMTLELIEESVEDAGILDFIKKAEGATERITRQIEFTREYQDIGVLEPRWQNVADIIVNAKDQLTECPYDLQVDPGAVEIYADPLLPKVFYNLLENAIRHGEHVTTVRFSSRESELGLTLVCEDDGAGVDAESKKHLFQKGFGKHTGFGLYLMREILGITGITIRETGEPGNGARFEMTVPDGMWRETGVVHDGNKK